MSVFLHRFGLGSSSSSQLESDSRSKKSTRKFNKSSNKPASWKDLLSEDEAKPLFGNGSGEYSDYFDDDEIRTEDLELSVRQRGRLPHDTSVLWNRNNSNIVSSKESGDYFVESKASEDHFMELEISEGDTLQNLSIRYHCPVAELKRINNLISNQEFFGLRRIRIPVKKHGLLTEILPNLNVKSEKETHHFSNDISNCNEIKLKEVRTVVVGIGPMGCGGSKEEAKVFLKKMDEDLVRIKNAAEHHDESCNEFNITEGLQFKPLVAEKKSCNDGIDCGIHWRNLLIIVLILGVVLPAVGALYMHFTSWNINDPVASSNITTVVSVVNDINH